MKNLSLLFLSLLCSGGLLAQNSDLSRSAIIQENGNWIEMLPDSRIEAGQFFNEYLFDLGFDSNYAFELLDESTDHLGYSHYRFQEHYNGIPVEGGTYILHVEDGLVTHANGKLIRGIQENSNVQVSAEVALAIAMSYMEAGSFYWENPAMEALIKRITKDPEASFYPSSELVIAQSQFSSNGESYNLAWKFEIYASHPDQKKTVYVDAVTGNVLFALEGCQHGSVEGTAETRYHGTQTIITDSISAQEYRLIDSTRGGGIETYDMNESDDDFSSAVFFTDEDNLWDNANEQLDDAATDAHWGVEQTYDYYLGEHARNSFDDNGTLIISYVHVGEGWFNATWNGSFMQFGDGTDNPLTSIDVVSHELTHGVAGTSAGLIYQNESGALNESFSDIFGTAVEFFALGEEADWLLGKENFLLRSLENPNEYGDPDTYQGNSWWNAAGDNGGVHTNSGVQNFWFYLLSSGGEGTNDNGDDYAVDSLGIEKAGAIAYRNLTVYLTESSNYVDARLGSILAAEDLYGTCSDEVLAVAQAWHAVGIGPATITPDFQVVEVLSPITSSCDLGPEEQMSMNFRFNPSGCGLSLEAGEEIEVSYQINAQDPIVETIVLTETLNDGDYVSYDFQTPGDLSVPDAYFLDYTVSYVDDQTPMNNEIDNFKITNPLTFTEESILAFEHFNSKDSLYVVLGSHGTGAIKSDEGVDESKGFKLSGFGASPDNVTIVDTDEENYAANPDFISKFCTCVDLPDWEEAYLNFDSRQTFSDVYLNDLGLDIDYMIGLRVLVDDEQIGSQFHPESNYSDDYENHIMDMTPYTGSTFTLCFEAINFLGEDEDFPDEGDKSTLDNIFFSQSEVTGLSELENSSMEVYPNPTNGLLTIRIEEAGSYELLVWDVLGSAVAQDRFSSNGSSINLDLSDLAPGTYVLSLRSKTSIANERIMIE